MAKSYKDKAMNYYNIFNEIFTSVIFILFIIFTKDLSDSSIIKLDLSLFCLIDILRCPNFTLHWIFIKFMRQNA